MGEPAINKGPWTAEENRTISEAQAKMGNKWTAIATMLTGRPENMIKNHWNSAGWKKQRATTDAQQKAALPAVAVALPFARG
jgi:hypothetical protein